MKMTFLTASFLLGLFVTGHSQTKNFIARPFIEVSGYADTLVTPNEIFIKINISEKDTKNKESLASIESSMVAALQSIGINTATDLTMSDMLSMYKYYILKSRDILKSKEYILKVSDAATVGKVFIQLEKIGISNIAIDRVDHTAIERLRNICRTNAIINAQHKAIALTQPLGQSVGKAIYIGESESNISNALYGRVAGLQIRGIRTHSKLNEDKMPDIEFKKIEISATVHVNFILE